MKLAGLGHGRPIATVLLFGLIPVATYVPALLALGFVAIVCASLITYEALSHRASRARIRSQRGAVSLDEALRV